MAIKIRKETGGRRGKTVTMISNIKHNPQVIEDLEKKLKKHCGAGGTSYAKTIEIQGDHVDKVRKFLEKEGFSVN
ncbi:translation initation factor SUI1, putative [Fodinibius roseus]|uniref:Translation initation factor SUI1, putative n=1 Tax=Fodinibius roseus TaxID=1194090 RepID=A0A1M5F624_9BACT|nr:translation initiation factor [Fodinibius roseus]SHF86993.1 translation initation factor SUI1, putative [Fodinibius roseus]